MKYLTIPLSSEISSAADDIDELMQRALGPAGVSLPQLWLLDQLARHPEGLTLGDLADALSCGRSNVTQLLDRLERQGLVTRTPVPDDRRVIRAELTKEGERRWVIGKRAVGDVEVHIGRAVELPAARRYLLLLLDDIRHAAQRAKEIFRR